MGIAPVNETSSDIIETKKGNKVFRDYCGDPLQIEDKYSCQGLNKQKLTQDFNKSCIGKKSCTFSIIEYIDYSDGKFSYAGCEDNKAVAYIQIYCNRSDE